MRLGKVFKYKLNNYYILSSICKNDRTLPPLRIRSYFLNSTIFFNRKYKVVLVD